MNIHSQWGKECIKEQQLRLWILESKRVMKLQYLDFNPTVICYKQNLMGTPFDGCFGGTVGGLQWEANFIWISALMSTGLTLFGVVCLCCKAHFCFSICSQTGFCFCFFYGTSTAVSLFYTAGSFAAPDCFLRQLHSFFSRLLSQTHLYQSSWASNIWYILVRDSLHFGSQLMYIPHRCAVLIIHFLLECI